MSLQVLDHFVAFVPCLMLVFFASLSPPSAFFWDQQLHHLVSDDVCLKVVELYLSERKHGAAGGNLSSQCVRAAKETSYQWKAERCMADENCFKVQQPLSQSKLPPFAFPQLRTDRYVGLQFPIDNDQN